MDELDIKKEALSAEKTQAVERVKQLEAAAKEKLELTKTRNEEKERATYALNKLQDTYQKKVVEYESQAQAAVAIIVRLRQEKQEANARAQLGVDRIRLIMSASRDRAQTNINECSEKVWKEWSQQAAELQTLRADAENRMKAGDKFYKMDEESIVTIREELSEDFFALAEEHLREIRGLVERLDDGQLETQLQLEKYEQDRQQQEAEGKTTPITISDEERPAGEQPTNTEQPRQEGPEEEPPVQINQETTVLTEEQLQANAGTEEEQLQVNAGAEEELAANRPVETGESDTGNRSEPEMEEKQDEPGRSGEEAPVQQEQAKADEPEQQPIQPEIGRETGTEQEIRETPLDAFEQSLLDILEEE